MSSIAAERAPGAGLRGVVAIVAVCAAVLVIGAAVSAPGVEGWHAGGPEPNWPPPRWVFGPVWVVLYVVTAVAASIVWLSRRRGDVCCPLSAFGVQLALGLAWSVCFFGLRSPLLGFLDVCLLWVMVAVTAVEFFRVSRTAGWLMAPYWLWVTLAAVLNAAIILRGG